MLMKLRCSLKLPQRFALLMAPFVIGFALYDVWSFKTLNDLKINVALYQRIVLGKDLIADILSLPEYVIESYLVTLQLINEVDTNEQNQLIDQLNLLKADYDKRPNYWRQQAQQGFDTAALEKIPKYRH